MKKILIIGAGPSGLIAAETILDHAPFPVSVTLCDRMAGVARKFLMAGRGGLNISHSEELEIFLSRYMPAHPTLIQAIRAFPPKALRQWCEDLGQETFIGSSGRIFPKSMKASPLLRAWLQRLEQKGVLFSLQQEWKGWDLDSGLIFENKEGVRTTQKADAVLFALGGASWPKLGSKGDWVQEFTNKGIPVTPLRPANCGFIVPWSPYFSSHFSGMPLKSVALTFGETRIQGDVMVTEKGIEGGPVYGLSRALREYIATHGSARLAVDLRPQMTLEKILEKLEKPRGSQSLSTYLKKALNLTPVAINLLREATHENKGALTSSLQIAKLVKNLPLCLTAPCGLDRAISTAGGVSFDAIDEHFMLKNWPHTFVAGEMLDWEAPTGGYLLQACFSTGIAAAQGIIRDLS